MNPEKVSKLRNVVQCGEEIAQILNSAGYMPSNERILGLVALAVSMMREMGLDYRQIKNIITSLVDDLEIYENIVKVAQNEAKTGEKM